MENWSQKKNFKIFANKVSLQFSSKVAIVFLSGWRFRQRSTSLALITHSGRCGRHGTDFLFPLLLFFFGDSLILFVRKGKFIYISLIFYLFFFGLFMQRIWRMQKNVEWLFAVWQLLRCLSYLSFEIHYKTFRNLIWFFNDESLDNLKKKLLMENYLKRIGLSFLKRRFLSWRLGRCY